MATGSYVYRDPYYGQRLILTLSRSGSTVSYSLKLQSTGSMYATVSWSLGGNVSRSGTTNVQQGSAFTVTLASGSFTRAAAASVSASATMFWGGRPTVSASITASTTKPSAAPTLSIARRSDKQVKLDWTAVGRASQYVLQYQYEGGSWATAATLSGRTSTRTPGTDNTRIRYRVAGRNSAGVGPYSSPTGWFYTKQNAPTNVVATFATDGVQVAFKNNARFPFGVEVEQRDTGEKWAFGTGTAGDWKSVEVDATLGADLQFRVRAFAGPDDNGRGRTFSAWSGWSNKVQGLQEPHAPSSLSPNGGFVAREQRPTISFRHNPADGTGLTRAQWRYRKPGGDWTQVVLDGFLTETSPNVWSHAITSSRWPQILDLDSPDVEWQVRTRGLFEYFSPWSATAVFTIISLPAVSVVTPEPGGEWNSNRATITWDFEQDDGYPQQAWQASLRDAYGDVIEEKAGSGSANAVRFDTILSDGDDYQVEVRAQAQGLWSNRAAAAFTVQFIPPWPPEIDGLWDEDLGGHVLSVQAANLSAQQVLEDDGQLFFVEA